MATRSRTKTPPRLLRSNKQKNIIRPPSTNKERFINVDREDANESLRSSPIKIKIQPQAFELKSGIVYQVKRDVTKKYHNLQFCQKVIVQSIMTTSYHPYHPFWPPSYPLPTNNLVPSFLAQNTQSRKRIVRYLEEDQSEQEEDGVKEKGLRNKSGGMKDGKKRIKMIE